MTRHFVPIVEVDLRIKWNCKMVKICDTCFCVDSSDNPVLELEEQDIIEHICLQCYSERGLINYGE